MRSELSKSGVEYEDSSDDDENGYSYDEAGNRLSNLGPDGEVNFGAISEIKSKWEDSPRTRREELARQRKEELQVLRARQCQVILLNCSHKPGVRNRIPFGRVDNFD